MSERNLSEHATQFSIGQLVDDSARRDAIHIAVAPVLATERLATWAQRLRRFRAIIHRASRRHRKGA